MDKKDGPKCICENCPSFVKCDERIAYCFTGKSKCIAREAGCLCPACPVQEKNGFSGVYYCLRGVAKQPGASK